MLVDFPCNARFNECFNTNKDRQKTKWPQDLCIGLTVEIGVLASRLLNQIIDFEDIKAFKPEEELLEEIAGYFRIRLTELTGEA